MESGIQTYFIRTHYEYVVSHLTLESPWVLYCGRDFVHLIQLQGVRSDFHRLAHRYITEVSPTHTLNSSNNDTLSQALLATFADPQYTPDSSFFSFIW